MYNGIPLLYRRPIRSITTVVIVAKIDIHILTDLPAPLNTKKWFYNVICLSVCMCMYVRIQETSRSR
jgi:hypothetical protein